MNRRGTAVLVFVVLLSLGFKCSLGPLAFKIVSPGPLVSDFSFDVVIEVPAGFDFDPNNDVFLNFEPLVVTGPGPTYTATINPGPPLRDENQLIARATRQLDSQRITIGLQFDYLPPKSNVRKITDPADLITGPLAHSKVGDYLIENAEARFIVQDVAQRDLYSVGAFGGNLIDAELVGNPGLDNFLEVQPMLNIETVINAQTVEIVNDGQDGTAAILRTCGPDDLLDFVNPSSQVTDLSLPFPALADDNDLEIEGCTSFSLEPGDRHVRLDTQIFNNQMAGAVPENLPLFVGDWMNQGGELDVFITPTEGVGVGLLGELGVMAMAGYDDAIGVDYGFTTTEVPSLPAGSVSNYFSISGVTVVLHNVDIIAAFTGGTPDFVVPLGGDLSFTRYFSVGDGTATNGADLENAIKSVVTGTLSGCVTLAGTPVAGAKVTVGRLAAGLGSLTTIAQNATTAAGPCPNYSATLTTGFWGATAGRTGTPYVGNAATPPISVLGVSAGSMPVVDFDLPATGTVTVNVTDENSAALPARVTVVGFDPSPELIIEGPSFPGLGGSDLGLLNDVNDVLPFGIVRAIYTDAAGTASFDLEPGSYEFNVTRGGEYSHFSTPVTVVAGVNAPINAQIARVIDTAGFVSSDFHVHGINSADSRVNHGKRARQFAGEGVENIVATDHHVHTDLLPAITALGFGPFLTSTIGEEITTFDYGHFNGYPFTIDASVPSGGSTDWAKPAPPGEDFPSFGNFNSTPAEIYTLATTGARSTPSTVVQVNHIGSHFSPLQIDTSVAGPISDDLDAIERGNRRLPVGPNLYHRFDALELWNGSTRGAQSDFLDERIGVWMNHLNRGEPITFIADTDTHRFTNLRSSGARTWTASPTDDPASVNSSDVADSIAEGKSVGGQGVFVTTRLVAQDGSGDTADLTDAGKTTMSSANGDVELEISVQAPAWAEYDTIEIYANAATAPVDPAEPYAFGATPTLVHNAPADFTLSPVNVFPAVAGATRNETTYTVPFNGLLVDTWFVVVVKGTDGVSEPMFPVHPSSLDSGTNATLADLIDGNLGESGVMALGATNALFFEAP
jgi:hypothetical protein